MRESIRDFNLKLMLDIEIEHTDCSNGNSRKFNKHDTASDLKKDAVLLALAFLPPETDYFESDTEQLRFRIEAWQ